MYAHLTDDTVDTWGDLPDTWTWPDGTVTTGWPAAGPAQLAAAGWHPVDDQRPITPPGHHHGPHQWTVTDTTVTLTCDLVADPPAAPDPDAEDLARARALALTLIGHEPEIAAAIAAMAPSDTARPALTLIGSGITAAAAITQETP